MIDKRLHKTLSFVDRPCSQHCARRQFRNARGDTLALRFALAQSDTGERRISEHAIGNESCARTARSSCKIVPNDPKIVLGDVSELRAAGAFTRSEERPVGIG